MEGAVREATSHARLFPVTAKSRKQPHPRHGQSKAPWAGASGTTQSAWRGAWLLSHSGSLSALCHSSFFPREAACQGRQRVFALCPSLSGVLIEGLIVRAPVQVRYQVTWGLQSGDLEQTLAGPHVYKMRF